MLTSICVPGSPTPDFHKEMLCLRTPTPYFNPYHAELLKWNNNTPSVFGTIHYNFKDIT